MKYDANSRGFIRHLHAFRGFAIISIVGAHAWAPAIRLGGGPETGAGMRLLQIANKTLVHDSTLYFALISGLLFALVLQPRGWSEFFKSKLLYVVSPYIVMTMLFTWFSWEIGVGPSFFEGGIIDYFVKVVRNALTGRAIFHFWYLPALVLLYLATPLLVWLLADSRRCWLIWPVMLAPLVASRTGIELSLGTVAYVLGAYAAGVYIGSRYDSAIAAFREYSKWLWLTVLLTTAGRLAMFLLDFGALEPVSLRETLFYPQKLAIAALVLVWFRAHEARLPHWLDLLATYAFSVYFLHVIFIHMLADALVRLSPGPISALTALATGLALLIVSIFTAVMLSALIKRALGKSSRLLQGV